MITEPVFFQNPLEDPSRQSKRADPCVMVIFGATGDLTSRKLLPALYNLANSGLLPAHFACVGFARRDKSNEDFRNDMLTGIQEHSRTKEDQEVWESFSEQLYYHRSDFDNDEGYDSLHQLLNDLDNQYGTRGNRVYYLSTQPRFFPTIIEKLKQHKLVYDINQLNNCWSRIIIEKPFGKDLDSAIALQNAITHHLDESQIYRIDHYLGKETVQNLLMFRFSNPIFESLWNNRHIDHVQITVAEEIGIGTRGKLWEEAGILRDIVQNHAMQLLSLVAMEPPTSFKANSIRDEKVKVVEAVRPLPPDQYDNLIVRGQYAPGFINGEPVQGYCQEDHVSPTSLIETYMALELYIDNWRWSGVPFFIRAGKRLPKRATEVSITFKHAPGFLFKDRGSEVAPNVLVIRIQPDEGISLKMNCKVPGLNSPIQPVKMDFQYGSYFGAKPPEAYERLLCDCMAGDSTLFARYDEVVASWQFYTPILKHWAEKAPSGFPNYPSGTWGPVDAELLMARTGRKWRML